MRLSRVIHLIWKRKLNYLACKTKNEVNKILFNLYKIISILKNIIWLRVKGA